MSWWYVAWTLLAACGRVDFDPTVDAGGGLTVDFTASEQLASSIEVRRASPATFTGADTLLHVAGPDEPRLDHNAMTGSPVGLIIEGPSTNRAQYSESLEHGIEWFTNGAVGVNPDAAMAPDGTVSADEIVDTDTLGNARRAQIVSISTDDGVPYTFSIFLKAGTAARWSFAGELLNGSTLIQTAMDVDLATGTILSAPALTTKYGILPYANGWYRVWLTLRNNASGNDYSVISVWGYLGNTAQTGTVLAWGAQVEVQESLTSYIPSLANTVTARAADAVRVKETSWLTDARGTLSVEAAIGRTRLDTQPVACLISAATACIARDSATQQSMFAIDDTSTISGAPWPASTPRTLELTWNETSTSFRDAELMTIPQRLPASAIGEVAIGFDGTRYLDGWVRRLTLAAQ